MMVMKVQTGLMAGLIVGLMTASAWAVDPSNGMVSSDGARIVGGKCKIVGEEKESLNFNNADGNWNCDTLGDLEGDLKMKVRIKMRIEGSIAPPDGMVNPQTARILNGQCKVKDGTEAPLNFNNETGEWNCNGVGEVLEGDKVIAKIKVRTAAAVEPPVEPPVSACPCEGLSIPGVLTWNSSFETGECREGGGVALFGEEPNNNLVLEVVSGECILSDEEFIVTQPVNEGQAAACEASLRQIAESDMVDCNAPEA